jgi:flavin reductase (DIM6/NTAB) family NADH-FMN oxidoreductase RutF
VSRRVEPLVMRRATGRFATGVAVVTTMDGERPHGMTINSLTSVSLAPPLLLVCFSHGARSAEAVTRSGRFAVNVLAKRQQPIALRFAARGEDHFSGLDLEYGDHEVPVVPNALAHLECEVDQRVAAGDHTVVIGAVVKTCTAPGEPLAFYSGRFADVLPHDAEPEHWFF